MKRFLIGFITLVMLAAMILPASAAFAAPPEIPAGSFVNAGDVPSGSTLVLNITLKVTNDEDSGNVGYWALDNYNRVVQVWQAPDGSFYAVARYIGKWQTFKGALSPGTGVEQGNDGEGTFEGGYVATFEATGFTSAKGNIGTKNYGGTKADVLIGTYAGAPPPGDEQTGPTTPFSYLSTYFTGVSDFTYINWGWTYHYKSQRWNNFDYGTTGDIVIP